MANIKVSIDHILRDGSELVFRAPCDCSDTTGLNVHHLDADGNDKITTFVFKDAHGNKLTKVNSFAKDTYVKVLLNTVDNIAYIYNADTNEYLEGRFKNTISLEDGIAIPKGSDLNTYIELGNFKCTSKSTVTTLLNCPTDQAFELTVKNTVLFKGGTYKTHVLTDIDGDIFTRYTYDDGINWTKWVHTLNDSNHVPTKNGGFGADISTDIGEIEHLKRVEDFVAEMNRVAQSIGMTNTIAKTPSGYCQKPVNESKNTLDKAYNSYITAKDALKLLIAARHTPTVLKAIGTEQHSFKVDYNTNGNVLHSILYNSAWKEWASSNDYTIVGAKGGSFTGSYGEIGSNGILNLTILIKDNNENNYGIAILGLQRSEIELSRTLIADLIKMTNGASATATITAASTRADYPICMSAVKLTNDGCFEDDIAMLENGIFYNENEVRVACSVIKLLTAITVASRLNNQYVSLNNDDFVGGGSLTGINVGTVLSTYDVLYVMLLVSDNNMATLLARIYGNIDTQSDVYVTPEMYGAVGDGITDDTKAWEDAVATGKRIVCEKNKTYLITSVGTDEQDNKGNAHLVLAKGQSIDFNGSTVVWKHPTGTYKCLFVAQNVSNIEISNGIIIGDRETNATEFLHPICLVSSNNIRISNMTIKETGGDGIVVTEYLTSEVPCKNIEIANCHIYHAYRNALSIIMADGVEIHGCKFEYTYGTSPHAGIDIEPNRYYQYCKNIKVHHCSFLNNGNRGFLVTYHSNPAELGVTLDTCYFENNNVADVNISSGTTAGATPDTKGYIDIRNCVAKYAGTNSITFKGHTTGNVRITVDDFTIIEPNQKGKTVISTGSAIYVNGYAEDDISKNIYLNNIHVIGDTHTRDLYIEHADLEYMGDFIKGAVVFSGSNAKLKALSSPVDLGDTLSLITFPIALYPSYVKPSGSTKDSTVNVGALPSKIDIEFINCSNYNINIVSGGNTYVISPNSTGMWIGSQQRIVGTKPTYTASEVGLGNVDNVRQYSESNQPPYPVTKVNGQTGDVNIDVPTKLSGLNNDIYNLVSAVATYEDGTTETLQLFVKK